MHIKEHPFLSDHLDQVGLKEGHSLCLEPLSGKRSTFTLKRTCINFVSADRAQEIELGYLKTLGSGKNESFHVQLKKVVTCGRGLVKKDRYLAKVLHGGPIKLNGNYVMECYLEQGDAIEIGFNRLSIPIQHQQPEEDVQEELIRQNQKIINSELPLLMVGETGVGKSTLARKIHDASGRAGKFVAINIASFSRNLLESELFGHVKGAFTGALNEKKGALREANGGTLFIDEIDSLPLEVQTKLLTFLDLQRIRSVGGDFDYQIKIRLICASGRDLKNLVSLSKMRKDFYFRVSSGHTFQLPSLRDNPELIEKFCQRFMREKKVVFTQKLIEFYQSLPWPGNVRQLKGHLERKIVLNKSWKIDFDEADAELIEQSSELLDIEEQSEIATLEQVKKAYVKRVFYQSDKNYNRAAEKLAISPRSVRNIMG